MNVVICQEYGHENPTLPERRLQGGQPDFNAQLKKLSGSPEDLLLVGSDSKAREGSLVLH
jgi:hypothetical protein